MFTQKRGTLKSSNEYYLESISAPNSNRASPVTVLVNDLFNLNKTIIIIKLKAVSEKEKEKEEETNDVEERMKEEIFLWKQKHSIIQTMYLFSLQNYSFIFV